MAVSIPTGFARLQPWQARLVLIAAAATAAFLVGITLSPWRSGFADAPHRGPGDVELYRAEVERVHHGQGYYAAAESELRARGYPTRSIFNWRMPLPVWLIGALPSLTWGKGLLGIAALGVLWGSFTLLVREGTLGVGNLGVLLLVGALWPCVEGHLFVMPEVWSGVLLALSLTAYARDSALLGVAAGVGALALRELAAPYCLICCGLALRRRQWLELALWLSGFVIYGLYLVLHLAQVLPRIRPDDLAHAQSWLCYGGAPFVISAAQMNMFLLMLPQWVTALYLVCALLGFASWDTLSGQRIGLTAAAYLITFCFVGQPFNQYWGSMIAPLLCLGAARFPSALADLSAAARGPGGLAIEPDALEM